MKRVLRKDQYSFSYSKIECYDQCGFKYKLHYFEDDKVFATNVAVQVGSMIHDCEETIANCIKAGTPIDYVALKNKIILKTYEIEHTFPVEFYEPDKAGTYYKDKINEYLDKNIYRLENYMKAHPELEIIAAEQSFKFTFGDYTFTGKIDRILKNKETGCYICQDIKTWPKEKEHKELTTPLQFVVYTLAMKELYGLINEQVSCSYDLPFIDTIQEAGTKGYMTRGVEKLNKLLEKIDKKDWEPNPSPLCYWCPYCPNSKNQPTAAKNRCPYYSLWTKEKASYEVANEWQGEENHDKLMENYIRKLSPKAV